MMSSHISKLTFSKLPLEEASYVSEQMATRVFSCGGTYADISEIKKYSSFDVDGFVDMCLNDTLVQTLNAKTDIKKRKILERFYFGDEYGR